MATITLSHWFDSSNDEYEFPVVFLGDLTDYPDGDHSTYGSICGMSSNASGPYSFKSEVRVGDFPHVITPDEELTATLASYGRYEGTFYASSATISGQIWFKMTKVFNDKDWITYAANSSSDSVSTNDYAPSAGTDYSKVRVMLGIGAINGINYLGLYYYGTGLGYNPDDPYNAWCFCYETGENSAWASIQEILEIDEGAPNPYRGEGYTKPGGGNPHKQNWGEATDVVNPNSLPTIGALASGLVTIFKPSEVQINTLARLLYSQDFFDHVLKSVVNIDDFFISLGMVPFNVTAGSTAHVTWLGFDFVTAMGEAIQLTLASEQYYEFNMGTINLESDGKIHASDSVFDYSPYSTLGIYLPFIGYQELDIDEFRGRQVTLIYQIDILSGTCVAKIRTNTHGDIYQFSGNCLTQIPLGSMDMGNIIGNAVNIAVAAASAGATSAIASAGGELASATLNAAPEGSSAQLASARYNSQMAHTQAQVSNASGQLAGATANAIMGMKPNFKHSGAIGASGSMLAVRQPYLFLSTPREAVPKGYEKYCGFPSNITAQLGSLSGFTVVEDIRLNGLVATSEEVAEIYALLKKGVII